MLRNQEMKNVLTLIFFFYETLKCLQICYKCFEIRNEGEDGCGRKQTI